ncbi:DUF6129 family protein [Uliginosibacterium gangwonense]|uniref:DUF6129 family protein n=1 Tax=Uliginosibacterium gangwonense TaxID=392736 RepID=UPI0003619897|nr:DUF6129 family protein [Uliginosibacterium gangwonense]
MITPEFIHTVCAALGGGNARRQGVDLELRQAFPGIPFTLCSDNDIPSRLTPLAKGDDFALYGINLSDHCASLTPNLEASGGIAIALIDDED